MALFFYRALEIDKVRALRANRGHFDRYMYLSTDAKKELMWWISNVHTQFRPVRLVKPSVELHTDASGVGWGATNLRSPTGGRWNEDELQRAHNNEINYLETLAVGFALRAYCSENSDIHVLLRIDNTTAVAYINKMGGTKSIDCNFVATEIWNWCMNRNIWLTASHLPGSSNVVADRMSRKFSDNTEWMLDKEVFNQIVQEFGLPDIDLFASRLNRQLDKYISWRPEPEAMAVDAFTVDWGTLQFYAFPPFCMVPYCLQKIQTDGATGLLVVPEWPTQSWFPLLQSMLVGKPLRLTMRKDLLIQPVSRIPHPLNNHLNLLCCRLGGSFMRHKDCQREQSTSS